MKIHHDIEQGSPEWKRLRALNFTASKLGPFAMEPVKVNHPVEGLKTILDCLGIARKGITKREDLISLLPDRGRYETLCDGARTAIIKQIKSEKMQAIRDKIAETNASGKLYQVTKPIDLMLSREEDMEKREENSFEHNIPVKYGKLLEPYARQDYEDLTGCEVTTVGFVEYGDGNTGFGCSPDGLIADADGDYRHGVEIKCPTFEIHTDWLLDGGLPDEHFHQVHACMAVTGLRRWDFFSFCPGEAPLLVTVEWSDETTKLEQGLKTLVTEKAKIIAELESKRREEKP